MEESNSKKENMKLLITIITFLLLAMAFLAYGIQLVDYGGAKQINVFFVGSFVVGVIALFFAFIAYVEPTGNLRQKLAYIFSVLFMLFLIQLLVGGLTGFWNIFGELSSNNSFWAIVLIMFAIVFPIISIPISRKLGYKGKLNLPWMIGLAVVISIVFILIIHIIGLSSG